MTGPFGSPSRRDFLKAGSAAALTIGALPSVHAAGADLIKVGVVGCGGRGSGAAENICEAAGSTYNIKIHALADVFEDRAKNCRNRLAENEKTKSKVDLADDRVFIGFDSYQKAIDCCDLVILATPPGFRPGHIEAVVKAGKHLFTEKPVAVDGTGIRRVLAAYEEAKSKKLGVVAGTQRRHQASYIEAMKRIHDGGIGELTSARAYWNQNNIWANGRKEGWSDVEYQLRNWYHFTWLCGQCIVEQHVHNLDVARWALGDAVPVSCVGMGGRQVNIGPEFGESYDHYSVDYEFPGDVHVLSQARQINGCDGNVSEAAVGTKGAWNSVGQRFTGANKDSVRVRNEVNPYVQEHIDLLASIVAGQPLNELKTVAESTMMAIMGRMSAFTGKKVSWDQALNSKLDTFPKNLDWKSSLPGPFISTPGATELI